MGMVEETTLHIGELEETFISGVERVEGWQAPLAGEQPCHLAINGVTDPFGNLRTGLGFTGQRVEAFGLLDYNARFYSPHIGRFISPDTIVPDFSNPQALNRYSYVYNNPVKFRDPSGHAAVCGVTPEDCGTAIDGELVVAIHRSKEWREETRKQIQEYYNSVKGGTVSLEASGSVNIPGLEGTADIGVIHWSPQGEVAVGTFSMGGGGTTDLLGGSGGPSITLTDGEDLTVLPGTTVYVSTELEGVVVNTGVDILLLPNDVHGLKFHVATGAEIPTVPLSLGGGADYFFDRALIVSKVTPEGTRKFGIFRKMTTYFKD